MPVTGTSTMVLYAPTGGTGLLAPCGTALCRHGIWYCTWLLGCTVYRPVPGPRTGPECTVGIRTISIVPQLLTCSCWCVESWMGTTAVGVGIPSYSSTAVVQTPKADSLFIAGLATMLAIGIPATAKTAPEFMKTEEYLDLVRAIH
jgi:hypothetical protein